jgi:hypothetical protein
MRGATCYDSKNQLSGFDYLAAPAAAEHFEQGWILLMNGVVLFDDGGAILPDGKVIPAPTVTGSAVKARG